jgi:hypothetical protein
MTYLERHGKKNSWRAPILPELTIEIGEFLHRSPENNFWPQAESLISTSFSVARDILIDQGFW